MRVQYLECSPGSCACSVPRGIVVELNKGLVTAQIALHMGEKSETHGDPCTLLPWGHAGVHSTGQLKRKDAQTFS